MRLFNPVTSGAQIYLESLMQGCETPNMNWQVTRAIAISEYVSFPDTVASFNTLSSYLHRTV